MALIYLYLEILHLFERGVRVAFDADEGHM